MTRKHQIQSNQDQMLEFVKSYRAQHGRSPFLKEIAAALNVKSLGTISKRTKKLEQRGLVYRRRCCRRAIELRETVNA